MMQMKGEKNSLVDRVLRQLELALLSLVDDVLNLLGFLLHL